MQYQDQVVKLTQRALDDLCRAALAVPEDKRDWSPMGDARTTLSQMKEIAASSKWYESVLREGESFGKEVIENAMRFASSLDTVEKCIEAARNNTSHLCQAILEFPDEDLEEEIQMPFGPGLALTMADIMIMHYANIVYHTGQINQIQLMLGDKVMH